VDFRASRGRGLSASRTGDPSARAIAEARVKRISGSDAVDGFDRECTHVNLFAACVVETAAVAHLENDRVRAERRDFARHVGSVFDGNPTGLAPEQDAGFGFVG
jgi:hypothetical protein